MLITKIVKILQKPAAVQAGFPALEGLELFQFPREGVVKLEHGSTS